MPELPEVETVRRSLEPLICRQQIVRVQVLQRQLRLPVQRNFELQLKGTTIRKVNRRGKYVLLELDSEDVWVVHLGMSGKLIYLTDSCPPQKHDHLVVCFASGHELRFHDPRRFGLCLVLNHQEAAQWPPLRHLGVDPLSPQFCLEYLYPLLHHSKRRVKDVLMDQRVVAGLGNIYVNEILFRSGLRPTRRGARLSVRQVERIVAMTPTVLEEAIRLRGTSFADYRDGENRKGEFQNHLKVYNRAGKQCRVCSDTIKRMRVGNRGVFYCATCQT